MKITAVITLLHPQSRAASDRWGSFLRIKGERNHWWMGRKLTVEEFNAEFPKAVKFAGPDRPLVGLLFVEGEGEGDAPEATEPVATITVEAHDAKIADIQAGVNAWQTDQNSKLEAAATQIADLEKAFADAQARVIELESLLEAAKSQSVIVEATSEGTTTTISEELDASASASPGSVPDSSGATNQANPPEPSPDSAPPAKKKASKK
jgi:hypothetical protein